MASQSVSIAIGSELMGVVDEKSPIWVKHAIRRWKQFYHEIQYADGQIDISNPLSTIFRNESQMAKLAVEGSSVSTESIQTKKEDSTKSQPEKIPSSKPEQKQSKGRFLFKIKELQFLSTPLSFF